MCACIVCLCACVHACVRAYVCVHVCASICMWAYVFVCLRACKLAVSVPMCICRAVCEHVGILFACVCALAGLCVAVHLRVCVFMCVFVHLRVCVFMCVVVHLRVCVFMCVCYCYGFACVRSFAKACAFGVSVIVSVCSDACSEMMYLTQPSIVSVMP